MLLVTGGTGFIGGHLLDRLSELHLPTKCILRKTSALRALPDGVEPVYADLITGDGLDQALHGVATVIHLAGATKGLKPADYYAGNVGTTVPLARALSRRSARLVHVSSLASAGPSADGKPVNEETEPHPFSHYGKSKLEAEQTVRRLVPDAVIVRPPVVYGPRDTGVFQIFKSVASGLVIEIAGGDRWVSVIFVRDLVEGILAAARTPQASGRTYFLSHPKAISWNELGTTAAQIIGRRPRVVRVPVALARGVGYCADIWARARRKPAVISREKVAEAECRYWTCDTRRAAAELGFEAKTDLEAGLRETLAWYKEAGWLRY